MSDEEKPEIKIDGTRVVCPAHGIRGVEGCCGDAPEPGSADDDGETGFDIVEAIKNLVSDAPALRGPEIADPDEEC